MSITVDITGMTVAVFIYMVSSEKPLLLYPFMCAPKCFGLHVAKRRPRKGRAREDKAPRKQNITLHQPLTEQLSQPQTNENNQQNNEQHSKYALICIRSKKTCSNLVEKADS